MKYISLLLFAILEFTLVSSGLAQSNLVQMQPNPITIQVGETAQLVVEIVDVQDLYGVDLLIGFDPNVLEVVDAYSDQEGVQVNLGTFLDPGLEIRNLADNTVGTVRFAMTQLNPSEPKSGSGVLVVITFMGKKISSSSLLTFEKVQLARRDGIEIQADFEDGLAQVAANASGATNTLVPTQVGGTPISAFIQTVTAMPSLTSTSTPKASNTPAPTNTKRSKNTPNPIYTQGITGSGGEYFISTPTRTVPASAKNTPGSKAVIQESAQIPTSVTEFQSDQTTEDLTPSLLETEALEKSDPESVSDATKDGKNNTGLSLLFVGIGIGVLVGIAGFGLFSFFKKR